MTDNDIIRCVFIPPVRCFDDSRDDNDYPLKVLNEAMDISIAWQKFSDLRGTARLLDTQKARNELVDKCADVIQATCNLLYSIGVTDMALPMGACEHRNMERGTS